MGHIEVEYLPALRISCLVFLGLCVAWLLSLACLTMSLRYEVLDLVYVNSVFLVIVTIYTLFMSFCVGVLLFYMVSAQQTPCYVQPGTITVFRRNTIGANFF